ncbi:hypothetical protein MMC12_007275 [Toensbergia leucococca]|nr:hypothetical protein [Toensbergia leucococca]
MTFKEAADTVIIDLDGQVWEGKPFRAEIAVTNDDGTKVQEGRNENDAAALNTVTPAAS